MDKPEDMPEFWQKGNKYSYTGATLGDLPFKVSKPWSMTRKYLLRAYKLTALSFHNVGWQCAAHCQRDT
jgi:hypothetical protein